ncbi:hypothetical protein BTO06_16775 [Tenacibaculum sp. SZ-18]|uniref:hypothetical protein n=1 Tax=Tenacibaculum sp. SZ-18 TaxID=754423 RepID=UPI000C2D2892|nr:hypothetical protein [Tenacibaculum sp. SZ-18]AUC16699.1 hypothetical protein BTO06_16775 [Tenacibaculum sp. SZ-18]
MRYFLFIVLFIVLSSCSTSVVEDTTNTPQDKIIWTGPKLTFTKMANTDATNPQNQDQITPSVAITRGTSGGQIYNIKLESSPNKDASPLGTKWAIGNISNVDDLTFKSFRSAVGSPKDVVGKNLVLFIEQEQIYLSVMFTSWGQGMSGSFSYERSTEN